jgi:kynurenine formamidase
MLSDALLQSIAGDARIYDLGQTLAPGMPGSNFHPPYIFSLMVRHGDRVGADGCGASNEVIVLSGHTGTHLDAIGHIAENGQVHGGADGTELERGGYGLSKLAIDAVPPMLARGVLLDVPGYLGVDALEGGQAITGDMLARVAEHQAIEVTRGDVVLIRTGWLKHWSDPVAFRGDHTGEPGPNASAAEWLAAHQILASGSDTIAYEMRPVNQSALAAHAILIVRHGIYIMEMVNCEEIARDKVYTFLFVALPLKIKGATGSPIRPIAIR